MPIRPLTVARPRPPRRLCTPPRGAALIALAIASAPLASADPNEGNGGGINNDTDISLGGNGILFLCPGVGAGTNVFGAGGGYCDMSFQPNWRGGGHVHCEWGGFVPVAAGWQCWRVFRGQPDHPRLPDPDIIPDGWEVPDALTGPTPDDQWPPAGLAPGEIFLAPPESPPEPEGPPPGP
jgi:hypothetical protein